MATVSVHMPENLGLSGFTLWLRKTSDGALVNAGGDPLTESPAGSGRFTATVTESWTETLAASVLDSNSLAVRDGWLAVGETVVRDSYPSAGSGGDASQATLLEVQETVNEILVAVSSVTITTTGYAQVNSDGTLLLKRGNTQTITFTSDTANIVPDLSDANTKVFLGIKDAAGRTWLTIQGSAVTPTGLQSVSFSPTPAQAKAVPKGQHFFDVIAVYGYSAGTADAEAAAGADATYTSLRIFATGRVNVDDLFLDLGSI